MRRAKALHANMARLKSEALAKATPERLRNAAYANTLIGETLNAAGRKSDACAADRLALAEYEGLRSKGLLTPYDERDNLAEVTARITRNCI